MRLATLATPAGPRPALRSADDYIDLLAADPTLPASVRGILAAGSDALGAAKRAGAKATKRTPAAEAKFLAPVPDPNKIICLGLNYRDHALESGAAIPNEPVLFSKYTTALTGHREPIVLPKVSSKVDYEAELVVVVGKRGRHIPV